MKFVSVNLEGRDCKGIFFYTNLKEITKISQVKNYKEFKFEVRTRVNGKLAKKVITPKKETFLKAFEEAQEAKKELRNTIIEYGSVKAKKKAIVRETNKGYTFLEKANEFLDLKEPHWSYSTYVNTRNALIDRSVVFHDLRIQDITKDDIQKFINDLMKEYKANTVLGIVSSLRKFLTYYEHDINWNKIDKPTMTRKKYKLKLEDTKRIVAAMREYSKMEIDGQIMYQHPQIRNIFIFLLSGRRINEVHSLTFDNIKEDEGIYTIVAERSKIKKEIDFPLTDELKHVIKEQREISQDNKVFHIGQNTIRRHFNSLLKALNPDYKLTIHDVRHMVASTLIQNNEPIANISRMLGHQSIQTTENHYAVKSTDQAQRATETLNKLVSNKEEDSPLNKKLEQLKVLFPNKTEDQLKLVLEVLGE